MTLTDEQFLDIVKKLLSLRAELDVLKLVLIERGQVSQEQLQQLVAAASEILQKKIDSALHDQTIERLLKERPVQ
jgi:hypothetical protein